MSAHHLSCLTAMLQVIDGTRLVVGVRVVIIYLATCLALNIKPRPSSRFAQDLPRQGRSSLSDCPGGLLGASGYGAYEWTWDHNWRRVAQARIWGAQSSWLDGGVHMFLWAYWL